MVVLFWMQRAGVQSIVVMARAVALLLVFLCTLAVADATARQVQRRSLLQNTWQNSQAFSQKCPGDHDWYSTPPSSFSTLYKRLCDPNRLPLNEFGNYSQVILDREGISGFGAHNMYFTGRFTMKLKLPPGNSSGTVFAYYVSLLSNPMLSLNS